MLHWIICHVIKDVLFCYWSESSLCDTFHWTSWASAFWTLVNANLALILSTANAQRLGLIEPFKSAADAGILAGSKFWPVHLAFVISNPLGIHSFDSTSDNAALNVLSQVGF